MAEGAMAKVAKVVVARAEVEMVRGVVEMAVVAMAPASTVMAVVAAMAMVAKVAAATAVEGCPCKSRMVQKMRRWRSSLCTVHTHPVWCCDDKSCTRDRRCTKWRTPRWSLCSSPTMQPGRNN